MKLLQESERKLSSIVMPGGWEKGLDQANVDRLRATIQEVIKVHGRDEAPKHIPFPPIIIDQADRLHAGRHRIAAFKSCSLASIRTAKYEFSGPREAEMVELRENLHRRVLSDEDQAKATKRLVELLTEEEQERDQADLRTEYKDQETASKPGPKKSAKARAVERAAEATGITEGGVRKRLERAEESKQPAPAPAVEMWGLRTDDPATMVMLEETAQAQAALEFVSNACSRSIAKLSEAFPNTALWQAVANLKEELHIAGRKARALRPAALCPFCKDVVAGCPSCQGRGVVGEGEMERAPAELKLGGARAMVCIGPGQFVPLAEGRGRSYGKARGVHAPKKGGGKAAAAPEPAGKNGKGKAKPAAPEKELNIELADGSKFQPEPDDADDDSSIPF